VTLDRARQTVRPGQRFTDVELRLDVRASRGGPHTITLPADAEVENLVVAGVKRNPTVEGGKLTLALSPGAQPIDVAFRVPRALSTSFQTPTVDVGVPATNASIEVASTGRWILFAWGPGAGPAFLLWSHTVVMLLCAVVLARLRWSILGMGSWLLLGLGLTQVHPASAVLIAGWVLAIGWRRENATLSPWLFNLTQLVLVALTVTALGLLAAAIYDGLLGRPDQQITGNGSSSDLLRWFIDQAPSTLPTSTVISVPLGVYRALMLAWALWLALALVRWLRAGAQAFATGGLWRATTWRPWHVFRRKAKAPTPASTKEAATASAPARPPMPESGPSSAGISLRDPGDDPKQP
jgi:hypothetical protein